MLKSCYKNNLRRYKMAKVFYFDVETTGLDPKKQDIIQVAYLIEINGEVKEEGNLELQPFDYASINPKALEISHRTVEDLKTYPQPKEIYLKLGKTFAKYVDKYNKKDKFTPAGYRVEFDLGFLREFWFKNGDKYFGSYFDYHILDPITTLYLLRHKKIIELPDYHLATVCKYFGIPLQAHDALSDIKATREVIQKVLGHIQ